MWRLFSKASMLFAILQASANGTEYVQITGGAFNSILNYEDAKAAPAAPQEPQAMTAKSGAGVVGQVVAGQITIAPFLLMRRPVTNAQFLAFVAKNPNWRRGQVPAIFAEASYLTHWQSPLVLGQSAKPDQPVVNVSWFAASAYCESVGARLANWREWEYVAAADATRADARADPAWRERILSWYAKPSNAPLASVGMGTSAETGGANFYGVQDLHGLVWEWPQDFASMMVSSDSRAQSEQDRLKFCGAGAISMADRENYAVLMRIAMLSALEANNVTSNLGFRCAKSPATVSEASG
jgi:formylglycine-generating enzyme